MARREYTLLEIMFQRGFAKAQARAAGVETSEADFPLISRDSLAAAHPLYLEAMRLQMATICAWRETGQPVAGE